jgi:hypothetical protein
VARARPPEWNRLRVEVLDRDGHRCARCWRPDGLDVHHVIAVADGGGHDTSNLRTLCAPCHTEWHAVEEASTFPFDRWLQTPPVLMLLLYWEMAAGVTPRSAAWDELAELDRAALLIRCGRARG